MSAALPADFWTAPTPRRVRLRLERLRAEGHGWEVWPGIVMQAPDEWREALIETQQAWRRAFFGQPPTVEDERMAPLLALTSGAELVDLAYPERACDWCGARLPEGTDPKRRYCSVEHRRQANYERERGEIAGRSEAPFYRFAGLLPTPPDADGDPKSAPERTAA